MGRSELAQTRYGDPPALVSPKPSIHPDRTYVAAQHCVVETIPLDQLEEWRERNNLHPIRAIGHYWPPMIYYEEISDGN